MDDPVQHALEVLGKQLVRLVQDQNMAVIHVGHLIAKYFHVKGIVSPDWKGLQMVSLDRFEV
jgi:hypothetical protein